MASEEYQEQPAANQPSSNQAEPESLESQESTSEQSDSTTIESEDIIEPDKTELSETTESLVEEDTQVQQSPETESVEVLQTEVEEDKELSSPATQSSSDVAEGEEETEPTPSQVATEVVADSSQEDDNKNWWDVILDKIRAFLPESINNSLSDWALTGIISGLIVLILSISVILLPSRSSTSISPESPEIVSTPKQEIEITSDSTLTEEEIELKETLSDSSENSAITSTPVEIETNTILVEPEQPENLTIKTTPPSKPVPTPEQSLFSAVQEKVGEITSQYTDELIVSGEADLLNSRLLITVTDEWYQLSKSRQDRFANETLQSSQKFNLKKLEIQDLQNNVIARSPVVGNKMIILQRTK